MYRRTSKNSSNVNLPFFWGSIVAINSWTIKIKEAKGGYELLTLIDFPAHSSADGFQIPRLYVALHVKVKHGEKLPIQLLICKQRRQSINLWELLLAVLRLTLIVWYLRVWIIVILRHLLCVVIVDILMIIILIVSLRGVIETFTFSLELLIGVVTVVVIVRNVGCLIHQSFLFI